MRVLFTESAGQSQPGWPLVGLSRSSLRTPRLCFWTQAQESAEPWRHLGKGRKGTARGREREKEGERGRKRGKVGGVRKRRSEEHTSELQSR